VKGPWYISARAVREYLAILGRAETDEAFLAAEGELIDITTRVVERQAEPRELPSGLLQYRGGRPLRLRLVVSTEARPEGPARQLVSVLPDCERRRR
jgi:hypothetical protein